MTRATFSVSAPYFAVNMAVTRDVIELIDKYPLAADAVHKSFYVDDGLIGADSIDSTITLQRQLRSKIFSFTCIQSNPLRCTWIKRSTLKSLV